MDDDVDQIDADPGFIVIDAAHRAKTAGVAEFLEIVAGGFHLPLTCAGGNDEKVGHRRFAGDVQHHYILTAGLRQKPGGVDREAAGFLDIGLDDRLLRRKRDIPPPVKFRSQV